MATEETALCSPLDKPLKDLTEEDISQLTREDCRRFLKQKGMRRPSWNKSQAIQQVISLKTLLEFRPESDNPAHAVSPSSPPLKVPASVESQNPVSASESVSDPGKDSTQSTFRGDALSAPPACDEVLQRCPSLLSEYRTADGARGPKELVHTFDLVHTIGEVTEILNAVNIELVGQVSNTTVLSGHLVELIHARVAPEGDQLMAIGSTAANEPATTGQMTIFYCGKVNVYEEMSSEKARAILVFAGSPDCPLPIEIAPAVRSIACHQLGCSAGPASPPFAPAISRGMQAGKVSHFPREPTEEGKISREVQQGGPTGRKASLQRYLEKRKDRARFKGKRSGVTTSGMEMYLSQQVRSQASTQHSSRSGTCSPTQPRPPHTPTRCGSVENQLKSLHLIVDLNDDDVQEA